MQSCFFLLLLRAGIARVGLNWQGTGGGRDELLQEVDAQKPDIKL